jgi:lipoyl synthase
MWRVWPSISQSRYEPTKLPSPFDGGGRGWGWTRRFYSPPLRPLPPGEGRDLNREILLMKDQRKPPWLKKRIPPFQDLQKVKSILDEGDLHTVCEEACCPNLGECFSRGTSTFLILGKVCTRDCGFCAVEHGAPIPPDETEPEKVAQAIRKLGLQYIVITSVTRDDLPDGGAFMFAKTIQTIRTLDLEIKIEVLIPDFQGASTPLEIVLKEGPDVLNHNIETIARLYPKVRPQADYERSIDLLKRSKEDYPHILTKSGFMLGLGEAREEVLELLQDLRGARCDFLTIGQYLQPRPDRLPVVRFIPPEEFEEYKRIGEEMGFRVVASGPFVRSSFHASQMFHSNNSI